MLLGILSDTHGRVAATQAALTALSQAGAKRLIHCGDVGDEPLLDVLAGLDLDFVWGNTDYDRERLADYAENLGLRCHGDVADLEIDGARIAVTHGDGEQRLKKLVASKQYQYLLHGHTHIARDQTIAGLRWINPGAVHRSAQPSVAALDTTTGKLRFIHLA